MPALLGVGNAGYTQISTNGTTTLNPGQPAGMPNIPSNYGVFYGADLIVLGTAPVLTVLDLVPPPLAGTNTATQTFTIFNGTGSAAGQALQAGVPGVGVRYKGALVAVTTGTAAGTWNALWD